MRTARVVPALFLAIVFAMVQGHKQSLLAQSNFKPSELSSVEGLVVKSTTGEPLKKITVQIYPLQGRNVVPGAPGQQEARSAVTDSSGHFVFRDLQPGRYAMRAGGNGYPEQPYGQGKSRGRRRVADQLEIAPGHDQKDILIRLQPPGVITGTVYDEEGDPVVGAQVQALRSFRQGRRRQIAQAASAQTDDRGEYRIYGLEAGQYLIAANFQRQQMRPSTNASEDVYLPTFNPNTPEPDQAAFLQLLPGDELSGINVELRLAHGVSVSGHVLSVVPAKTLQGTYLSLLPRNSSFSGYVQSNYGAAVEDPSGNFTVHGVPPGPYFLTANWGDEHGSYFGRVNVDVGTSNVEGITLILGPGLDVHGRFRTDADAKLNLGTLGLMLEPTDGPMGGGGAEVKPDGTFVIRNLYDGNYRLRVGGFPEQYYVKWARMGGLDVLDPGLTISHSQPPGQLEVMLTLDGGQVDGTVLKDQKPYEGAMVVLVPDPPLRNHEELYSFKRTDSLGRYSMLGLPPGDFKLFAWEPVDGVDFRDADFIKQYEDRGTRVHIEEKKQQNMQLELIPAEQDPQE